MFECVLVGRLQHTAWRIYIQRLTGDICSNVVANELPAFLQDIPLLRYRQKYCKNDGSRPHFCKRAKRGQSMCPGPILNTCTQAVTLWKHVKCTQPCPPLTYVCFIARLPLLICIQKSHNFTTASNWTHVDTAFFTWIKVRNWTLKLLYKYTGHYVQWALCVNESHFVGTIAPPACCTEVKICVI
jgi:hypothetical protein